ncbi:MAG: FHA domain-containing protein [Chthoniobacterales bacterium]|nr:FHA domain-containing protein [Chthoniobacterales bacterium]
MRLTVYFPEDSPTIHEFVDNQLTVGRLGDNDIALDEGSVSSRHAQVVAQDGEVTLHDLGSTNGTFVNGEQVTGRRVLNDGDEIYFGSVRSVFLVGDEGAPAVVQEEVVESGPIPPVAGSEPAATSGGRPGNFSYMSPLPRPVASKDKLDMVAWGLAGVGVLAACYAVIVIVTT